MKIFLVHRFLSRKSAIGCLKHIAKKEKISLDPIVLDSSGGDMWKLTASLEIEESEAVVVYDPDLCGESENAKWEIERAIELKKPIIFLKPKEIDREEIGKLCDVYHFSVEFNSFFKGKGPDTKTLYKLMVRSSEELIQRRQKMNAFFITAIGSLMAIAGALAKFGTNKSSAISYVVLSGFGVTGLLLCNSWRKLIDNYGKLNEAKYKVILKLEENLSAQIFSAEWAALGKGLRPKKYQSFTSSENMVPLWFSILIFSLVFFSSLWKICAGNLIGVSVLSGLVVVFFVVYRGDCC